MAPSDRLLPSIMVEHIVRSALLEDLGRNGDITSAAVVPSSTRFAGAIVSRQSGVVSGIEAAAIAFRLLDPDVELTNVKPEGSSVEPGDVVLQVRGMARAILSAERVALNFASHLSGVATATARLVAAAKPHGPAKIVCTRKTTPGLRALEKQAVRAGGGSNHRFGLDDAILIKDNHIALAGSIRAAVAQARDYAGHLVKIEVEADTLVQVEEALAAGADAILLDNMSLEELRAAVAMVAGRAVTEASGRIDLTTVAGVAATGVDLISVGWITHSAPILDLGLDVASV